jgi:hypothetical protein
MGFRQRPNPAAPVGQPIGGLDVAARQRLDAEQLQRLVVRPAETLKVVQCHVR